MDPLLNTLLENVRGYTQAQLNRSGGLCQRANRNEINPGEGVLPDIFERDDAARGFEWDVKTATAHDTDCFFGLRLGHIVQQERLRPAIQGLLELHQIANL